jgi:hypothetical protein
MSTEGPRTKVDLDLDALQPEGKTLRFQGKIYRLPAEIPIPIINRALQLSDKAAASSDSGMVGIELLNDMQALVIDVLKMENDDVPDQLPWGMDSLSRVMGLMITGRADISLEEAVLETLQPPGYEDEAEGKEGKGKDAAGKDLPPTAKTKSASRSRKPSPAVSSN